VTEVQDLDWLYPPCTVCDDGGEMEGDGVNIWCRDCGATWDEDGTNGQPCPGCAAGAQCHRAVS